MYWSNKLISIYHITERRWQLPESENSVSASTANELRQDRHATAINPEKLKAAAEGLTHSMSNESLHSFNLFDMVQKTRW